MPFLPIVLVLAAAGGSLNCSDAGLDAALRTASPKYATFADDGGGLGSHRCGDVTGDGSTDAVYTIDGGGTGRASIWGLVVGDGPVPRVTIESGGGTHLVVDLRGRAVDVANPVYRRDDPNCCPTGGARIRSYRWAPARRTLRADGVRHIRRIPRRFYG